MSKRVCTKPLTEEMLAENSVVGVGHAVGHVAPELAAALPRAMHCAVAVVPIRGPQICPAVAPVLNTKSYARRASRLSMNHSRPKENPDTAQNDRIKLK